MSDRPWPPPTPRGPVLAGAPGAAAADDDWLTGGVLPRRVLGFLADLAFIAVAMAVLWLVLVLFGVATFGLGMPLLAVLPAVPPLYHFGTLASPLSATPGQALLGLSVRRNRDLGRPHPFEALVSVAGFYATLALGAIWLLVALITTRRRTLHDLLSGLVVVRSDLAPPLTERDAAWNMRTGGSPSA